LDQHDFDDLSEELLSRLGAAGPVDGVLLALHGALVTENLDDPDGTLLARIREIVGTDCPIVASLDLHANVTRQMVEAADALVGFRTYPHVDMLETGERAAELLFSIIRDRVRPTMAVRKIPLLIPPENAQTTTGPCADVWSELRKLETSPQYLSTSLFTVQPWLDVAELGCTVLAVHIGASESAQRDVDRVAQVLWSRRHEFHVPLTTPAEAVQRALAAPEGPIVLVDSADSVSSGSPGDSTAILRALVETKPDRLSLVTVVDPDAARRAVAADGSELTLSVGGRMDPFRNLPVSITGVAHRVPRAIVQFTGGVGDGLTADMGTTAILEAAGLRVVVMENPVPCYDPALYRAVGLDPAAAHLVVVKSPNNFRWTYRDIMRDWIYVDAPGASTPRLESLRFERAPRPLYPFDDWDWQSRKND
jgi:microcystin degradation protein MlrC